MPNIAFYGSHNSAYVVEDKGEILAVLEVERFLNLKNSGMAQYLCPKVTDILFYAEYIPKFLMKKFGIEKFDNCYYLNTDIIIDTLFHLQKYIVADNYIECKHHEAHAAGTFYQSSYEKALIFSFDGGGNDGKYNVYTCERGESPKLLEFVLNPTPELKDLREAYDLGFPYMIFGHFLADINYEPSLGTGNLVYPGKLMGLASYGTVNEEWLPHFIDFYEAGPKGSRIGDWEEESIWQYQYLLNKLTDKIGIVFNDEERLTGQLAYDVAATNQRAFEECFLKVAKPYMEQYPDYPICITGGCGLNIILNTRLKTEFNREVFVGPDPNDCGVALGVMLNQMKPLHQVDCTYAGLPLLDLDMLGHYIQGERFSFKTNYLDMEKLVDDLSDGYIVGVARGNSEHGPRALGNRSIICNPLIPDMKDILNAKVKHREWYRPFAPVVRLEDVSEYFEWEGESRWMSFCPKVKEEWQDKLPAITHVDGTARVQTVTKEQNEWLYNLLTAFKEKTGVGVLLNTSFNVDGKPILSTLQDAFTILERTQMDCLVIEDYYIKKPR